MAETPKLSKHMDAEETSIAEEGVNLVDTVDDPALACGRASRNSLDIQL